tara:strand:- start:539 stop:901 length:363 start_codon:yes stop_codon:yes gene_type:complete
MIFKHPGLYIDKSPVHGWGLFTKEDINKGDLIEESPMASITNINNDYKVILDHLMRYPKPENDSILWFIPTGYSIHLNRSDNPNVKWNINEETFVMSLYATRDIKENEELFIIYQFEKQK